MLTRSVKSPRLGRTVFAAAAFLFISFCAGVETRAGFVNLVVVQDMPTRVVITVEHVVGGAQTVSAPLLNWDVVISEFVVINNMVGFTISSQHEIFGPNPPPNRPHPGDVNPNPNPIFRVEVARPGVTMLPLTLMGPVSHPAEHFDWLQYTYVPTAVNTSLLVIQFDHTTDMNRPQFIPEPATLLLLGTGLAGVAAAARRRRRGDKGAGT